MTFFLVFLAAAVLVFLVAAQLVVSDWLGRRRHLASRAVANFEVFKPST